MGPRAAGRGPMLPGVPEVRGCAEASARCGRPTPRSSFRGDVHMNASRNPGFRPGLRGLARWTGLAALLLSGSAFASEAELQLPDLSRVTFLGGTNGRSLLMWGLLICLFGFGFGIYQFAQLRK